MAKLFANSADLDQMPYSAASDLGLHCLPVTPLGVSRLQLLSQCLHYGKSGSQRLPKIALGLSKINDRKSGTPNF